MQPYYTAIRESPTKPLAALLIRNPFTKIMLFALQDQTSRILVARPAADSRTRPTDAVIISAGDNPIFAATAIGMIHLHNLDLEHRTSS